MCVGGWAADRPPSGGSAHRRCPWRPVDHDSGGARPPAQASVRSPAVQRRCSRADVRHGSVGTPPSMAPSARPTRSGSTLSVPRTRPVGRPDVSSPAPSTGNGGPVAGVTGLSVRGSVQAGGTALVSMHVRMACRSTVRGTASVRTRAAADRHEQVRVPRIRTHRRRSAARPGRRTGSNVVDGARVRTEDPSVSHPRRRGASTPPVARSAIGPPGVGCRLSPCPTEGESATRGRPGTDPSCRKLASETPRISDARPGESAPRGARRRFPDACPAPVTPTARSSAGGAEATLRIAGRSGPP